MSTEDRELQCAKCGCYIRDLTEEDKRLTEEYGIEPDHVLCDGCYEVWNAQWEREQQRETFLRLQGSAYQKGRIQRPTLKATFLDSNRAAEGMNRDQWVSIREHARTNEALFASNLWLCGNAGVGKTYAARCLLNRAIGFGFSVYEVTGRELLQLGTSFSDSDKKKFKDIGYASFVLVDDIDKAVYNERSVLALFEFLNTSDGQSVVASTANMGRDDFVKHLIKPNTGGNASTVDSIDSRLNPLAEYVFEGEDLRLKRKSVR